MLLHVRKLNGPFFDLTVGALDTVGEMKAKIGSFLAANGGGSMAGVRAAFENRQLDQDERMLVTYGVSEGSTIVVYGP